MKIVANQFYICNYEEGFPGGSVVKNPSANADVGLTPWRRKWQPTPVFLPEKSHGQRILASHKGLQTTIG